MQLHVARLCLDCQDVHDQQTCPVCSSESFAYISRWIPTPERRTVPRPAPAQEHADTYRQLLNPERPPAGLPRWATRGIFGLAAVSMAGWMWLRKGTREGAQRPGARSPSKRPKNI
jgi:hypothetical protein